MRKSEIEECIARYGKDLYSFCCYLTANRSEADDLYQDTFVKVIELGIDLEQNPKSFILSVAYKLWRNKSRKIINRNRLIHAEDISEINEGEFKITSGHSPEEILIQNETDIRVQNAVRDLPDKLRPVALLYYMEDRSVEEIANIVHVPKGTVKSRLFKARKLLHDKLEGVL